MELPWQGINASRHLTSHFLTNVTEPQLALSFSFRGCLWSSGFLKNFVFQTSHFPCLCIKRNRWCKPQGDKANKIQPPRFQHSRRYHLIHIGPQMAFKWDQRFASGHTHPGRTAIRAVRAEGTSQKSALGRLPPCPSPGSFSCQLCVLSSKQSADCSVPYKVSSSVVHQAFSSCLT